jgi:hypothetical protein
VAKSVTRKWVTSVGISKQNEGIQHSAGIANVEADGMGIGALGEWWKHLLRCRRRGIVCLGKAVGMPIVMQTTSDWISFIATEGVGVRYAEWTFWCIRD